MDADRIQMALLAAVGHDLRSPLAAAKAAISGLRARDVQLTAADHDELLATAEESLDLLTRLAAILVDMTRLQAGGRAMFPWPADPEEIIGVANVTANALRYSPPGSPPLLTASARGDRVELRGLGLAVSRDLTEAMGGTLRPEQTPGGGLTMIISMPAAGHGAG